MTRDSTVTRLSDLTGNVYQVSPAQAIQDLQEFLKDNPDFNKVFLVAVNTKDQEFNYAWFKGQILCSEAITALHLCLDDLTQAIKE